MTAAGRAWGPARCCEAAWPAGGLPRSSRSAPPSRRSSSGAGISRGQIAWISRPGWADADHLASWLALGSAASVAVIVLLAVLGGCHSDPPTPARQPAPAGPPQRTLTRRLTLAPGIGLGRGLRADSASQALIWLAVPWLVLPPLTLLAGSEVKPVYSFRYITFCLPAVALLAGAGPGGPGVGRPVRRRGSPLRPWRPSPAAARSGRYGHAGK